MSWRKPRRSTERTDAAAPPAIAACNPVTRRDPQARPSMGEWNVARVVRCVAGVPTAAPALLQVDFVRLAAHLARPSSAGCGPLTGVTPSPGEADSAGEPDEGGRHRANGHPGRVRA